MTADARVGVAPPSLEPALIQISADIDRLFGELLAPPPDARAELYEAMRYAAIGGGKRLRPLLVAAACSLYHVDRERALRAGLAVECIHVYSLIHDDLPCMDDDDLRRGKPTLHRAFDESTAILAGDSLHALAFEILAHEATHEDPFVRAKLVAELARAAGPAGMAGGQMMDLGASGTTLDLAAVTRLQQLKTGALIGFCLDAGAIMGRVPPEARTRLRGYARDVGLAFQITDDLLDIEGEEAKTGKRVNKDKAAGKETFVSLLGPERARQQAGLLVDQAIEFLQSFGPEADLLRSIARFAVERDHWGIIMRTGVYPGTFDPITLGHMDIIRRGAKLVDRLVIGVTTNPSKSPMFSLDQRIAMVLREIQGISGDIQVVSFNSLLMDFAERESASVIIRGLRAVADFEYEYQMAGMNQQLNDRVETVFLMADVSLQPIASRLVKEIALYGGDIRKFVPLKVAEDVRTAVASIGMKGS